MKRPTIALVSGFWGQNIGNAFFNIGGKWILEQIFGENSVNFIQDQPGYRTFNNQARGNPANDAGLLQYLECEYIVLQGPMLTTTFRPLWEKTFQELRRRGTKIVLLGAALFKFTDEEKRAARQMLADYPPEIIVTRDPESYECVKDMARFTYSGLDSAFFVPKAYTPLNLSWGPYVTLAFDRYPEPTISVKPEGPGPAGPRAALFSALGHEWALRTPAVQEWFSRRGKAQSYIGALLDRRRLPAHLAGHRVVRPEHRFNPHVTWKIYKQPNAVASDEPFTYFTVYSQTALTLSDRVHACVMTLAYGRPAMLFTPSPRSRLFDRVGLPDIRKSPCTLDPSWLEDERSRELAFLSDAVNRIGR